MVSGDFLYRKVKVDTMNIIDILFYALENMKMCKPISGVRHVVGIYCTKIGEKIYWSLHVAIITQ